MELVWRHASHGPASRADRRCSRAVVRPSLALVRGSRIDAADSDPRRLPLAEDLPSRAWSRCGRDNDDRCQDYDCDGNGRASARYGDRGEPTQSFAEESPPFWVRLVHPPSGTKVPRRATAAPGWVGSGLAWRERALGQSSPRSGGITTKGRARSGATPRTARLALDQPIILQARRCCGDIGPAVPGSTMPPRSPSPW